jgi:hypothetical protein
VSRGDPAANDTQVRWVQARHALSKWLIDGVLVLPPGADHPFVLSASGAAVWSALAQPRSVAEVVAELAERYATDPIIVRRDVGPLIEELTARGGLERVT